MPKYAYIDESGINYHEIVMTVSIFILEGSRSARSVQMIALKSLFGRQLLNQIDKLSKKHRLHFSDMSNQDKLTVGGYFRQANIACYASCYWHKGGVKNHETRFAIYKALVKLCLCRALEDHKDLIVAVAKQGGWQSYKHSFLGELKEIPEFVRKDDTFCKAKFELASAANPGVQIADFYAGTIRHFLKSGQIIKCAPAYDLIKHQIVCIETWD